MKCKLVLAIEIKEACWWFFEKDSLFCFLPLSAWNADVWLSGSVAIWWSQGNKRENERCWQAKDRQSENMGKAWVTHGIEQLHKPGAADLWIFCCVKINEPSLFKPLGMGFLLFVAEHITRTVSTLALRSSAKGTYPLESPPSLVNSFISWDRQNNGHTLT